MQENLLKEVKTLSRLVRDELNEAVPQFKHKTNLTEAQIVQYLFKHENEKVYLKDLVENLNLSKSTITERLDIMESNNLIKRIDDNVDKRKKRVVFTQEAIQMRADFDKVLQSVTNKMLKGIKQEKIDTFLEVLETMKRNISKE